MPYDLHPFHRLPYKAIHPDDAGYMAYTVEGGVIGALQLPGDIITGKLGVNSVGSGQTQSGSVGFV